MCTARRRVKPPQRAPEPLPEDMLDADVEPPPKKGKKSVKKAAPPNVDQMSEEIDPPAAPAASKRPTLAKKTRRPRNG